MRRSIFVLLTVLALTVAVFVPVAAGAADSDAGLELANQGVTVEKSPTGSYIVVMAIEPLLAEFEQDELNSRPAQNKARGLKK